MKMQTVGIDSRKREHTEFGLDVEKYISHEELKTALTTVLKLDESKVAVYSYGDSVDNYDDVVAVVKSFETGFKTNIEIHNRFRPENPLTIVSGLSAALETPILIDAQEVAAIYIMCTTDGQFSYVKVDEDNDDTIIKWSLTYPCKPYGGLNNSHVNLEQYSIEDQSSIIIDKFAPYLHADYSEIQVEFGILEIDGYQGQVAQLFVCGINNAGQRVFLDIENISFIAYTFELISVLSGGDIAIAKNLKFKITKDSLELEQDSPGRAYKYSKEN